MRSVELSGWNLFAIFTRLRQVYACFFLALGPCWYFCGVNCTECNQVSMLMGFEFFWSWSLLWMGWTKAPTITRLSLFDGQLRPLKLFRLAPKNLIAINPFEDVTSEQPSSISICKYSWYVNNILTCYVSDTGVVHRLGHHLRDVKMKWNVLLLETRLVFISLCIFA